MGKYESNPSLVIGFMGGDSNPLEVENCCAYLRKQTNGRIKTPGIRVRINCPRHALRKTLITSNWGPTIEKLGGLDSPTTNQLFYRIDKGKMTDITCVFSRKRFLIKRIRIRE
jgi:anaerobic ribonucleoside-triphosphate reductase activating protein